MSKSSADVDRWKDAVVKELAGLSPAEQDARLKRAREWFHAEMDKLGKKKRKPAPKKRVRVK